MSLVQVTTTPGTAVPPQHHHAVTTHMPTWQAVLDFLDRKPELMMSLKNMYPRMMIHRDIHALAAEIKKAAGVQNDEGCMLFTSLESARELIAFVTDARRGSEAVVPTEALTLKAFQIDVIYWAIFYPAERQPQLMKFWTDAGVGISSRMAEESLKHLQDMKEIPADSATVNDWDCEAIGLLKDRIISLAERAVASGERSRKVKPEDIYFFQNGMASIWWTHQYLNRSRGGSSVLYGFPFHCTLEVLKEWGSGMKHLGSGSAQELEQLDEHCKSEAAQGRSVQAVWAEFPANPMLTTPNLDRLRELADKHKFILCIDETIGSFCNVDVLGSDGADLVITSLTKSFNGHAETMGGSVILNPLSPRYDELTGLFRKHYHNDTSPLDLVQLERNSRDYLPRSVILNKNAQALADYLYQKSQDPDSAVSRVMYPSVSSDKANFDARKRAPTADFEPGYGCLLSIDFDSVPTMIAFYDEVGKYVHIGPHLGANKTLVLCYNKVIYAKELENVRPWGLLETALRVSVGFDDAADELLKIFKQAIGVADLKKAELARLEKGNGTVVSSGVTTLS